MAAPVSETSRPGTQVGPTSEFTLFFRVKPGQAANLREALRALFDDDTRLLFATSFDGPWDAYMEDFFTSGPTLQLFDVIFRHVEGYDGLPNLAALKKFITGAQETAAA